MRKENREKLLVQARKRYKDCTSANTDIVDDAKTDLKFLSGDQWDEQAKKDRADDKRPCLVINKLNTYANQVANDQRQNRPQIKVRPVDNLNDPRTAKVINGLIKHIEQHSDAAAAYDTAHEYAVECGVGYIRLATDYVSDKAFEQEILIKRIKNPFSVIFPFHLCKESDFSDVPYVFVIEKMGREEYKSKYKVDDQAISEWDLDAFPGWVTDDTVTVAEYWYVEEEAITLYQLEDGTVTDELPDGAVAVKSRPSIEREVKQCVLSAGDVLETNEFASKYIPIVPVVGKEIMVEGKEIFISLVRFARDAQAAYNYWVSAETETIALAPRTPYIGAFGQFEGFETDWASSNTRNVPYLQYNPITAGGQLLGAPQRTQSVSVPTGIVQAKAAANDDIKATTGLFDPSMGAQSNEQSGRAIIARQRQGDTTNFHFTDNLSRALRQIGKIIIDLIPTIYDTPRIVRILGDDLTDEIVAINQQYTDPKTGQEAFYDLTVGQYDVVVDVGPSFVTQRAENAENMIQLMQAVPVVGQIAGDLAVKAIDVVYADEISERIKRTIPPQITGDQQQMQQQAPQGEFSPEEMAQIMGDMQRLQSENEQMQQALGQTNENELNRQADIAKQHIKSQADIEKTIVAGMTRGNNQRPALTQQEAMQ